MRVLMCILLIGVGTAVTAIAQSSQFERYSTMGREALLEETRGVTREIQGIFNEGKMAGAQARIDFSDYFSNLKKIFLYGARLAVYADYEADLEFARENALFKGLPEVPGREKRKNKTFISEKYDQMRANVQEEIATYEDLILLGLEACESQAESELSRFIQDQNFRKRVQRYLAGSKDYRNYLEKMEALSQGWPELVDRIRHQLSLWQERGNYPADPLIDLDITEAVTQS